MLRALLFSSRSSTPYASTFRRIWSGRGSAVLKAPLQKLRSSIKRRPSSTDLSVERQLSRKLSFQGTGQWSWRLFLLIVG